MTLLTSTMRGSPVGSSATLPLQPNHSPWRFLSAALTATAIPPASGVARSVRNSDAVRNYNEARAHASSQLDDSLVAVLMIPAME